MQCSVRNSNYLVSTLVLALFFSTTCLAAGSQAIVSNVAPDVNIVSPNGGESISGTFTVDFNVVDPNKDDLNFKLAYSSTAGSFQNIIVSNSSLSSLCTTTNWYRTTRCSYSWDTNNASGIYYLDINVFDSRLAGHVDSTANNFMVNFASSSTLTPDYNSSYALNSGLGGIDVSWSSVANATGYDLWRSSDYNLTWQKIVSNALDTSYNDSSLADNSPFFYKLGVRYAGGDLNSGIDANITVDRTSPSSPPDLNVWASPADLNSGNGYSGATGGLVGYWRFEDLNADTNKTSDLSGNGNNGTLTNFACNSLDCNAQSGWVSSGQVGKAMRFEGSNDYINVGNRASLVVTNAITMSAWVYSDVASAPAYTTVLSKLGAVSDYAYKMDLSATGTKLRGYIIYNATLGCGVADPSTILANTWYHVVYTFDGTNCYLYKNSLVVASRTVIPMSIESSTDPTYIGSARGISQFWDGRIDEVKIFNRALSAQEIAADYNAGLAKKSSNWATVNWVEPTDAGSLPVDVNTVGYWRLQEGTGTVANDSSGRGNTGTLTSFACTTLDCNSASGWSTNGRKGNGLVFDGSDDAVGLPANACFTSAGNFTMSAWVKTKSISGYDTVAGFGNAGDELFFGLYTGKIVLYSSHLNPISKMGNTILPLNVWQHIVFVRNGASYYFYLNGLGDGSGDWNSNAIVISNSNRTIGRDFPTSGTEIFHGSIDEVQIWNRALTANDVNLLYQKGSVFRYSLLRGISSSDVNSSMVVDLNSTVFSDFNAVDSTAPNVPSGLEVSNATASSLDVDWDGSSDNGTTYYYRVKAKDFEGNDANAWSIVDSNTVTSGVWRYWLKDANQSDMEFGPFNESSGDFALSVENLGANSQHCFGVKAQDNVDNNSAWSNPECAFSLAVPLNAPDVNCLYATGLGFHCIVSYSLGANSAGTEHFIDANGGAHVQDWNSSTSGQYIDSGLSAGGNYCYRIMARNGDDVNTSWSNWACSVQANVTPVINYIRVCSPETGCGSNRSLDPASLFYLDVNAFDPDDDLNWNATSFEIYTASDSNGDSADWDHATISSGDANFQSSGYGCTEGTGSNGTSKCIAVNASQWSSKFIPGGAKVFVKVFDNDSSYYGTLLLDYNEGVSGILVNSLGPAFNSDSGIFWEELSPGTTGNPVLSSDTNEAFITVTHTSNASFDYNIAFCNLASGSDLITASNIGWSLSSSPPGTAFTGATDSILMAFARGTYPNNNSVDLYLWSAVPEGTPAGTYSCSYTEEAANE